MAQRLFFLIPQCLLALAVGIGTYGTLTYTMFDQWRKESLVEGAYAKAKKKGIEAVDHFVLAPGDSALAGLYTPLTEGPQKEGYEKAKAASEEDLDAWFRANLLPPRWPPWLCLLGLFLAAPLLGLAFRRLFQKVNKRMAFIMTLVGLLGGYFSFLVGNEIYPLGIDLAGGTELIYRLDTSELERRIAESEERLNKLEALKAAGKKDEDGKVITEERLRELRRAVEGLDNSRHSAPEKAVDVVRKRVDPTGTKGIPITKYGEGRIRIQLPKASPEEVERIQHAISTQGRLTFHLVADDKKDTEIIKEVEAGKPHPEYMQLFIEKKDPYDPNAKPQEESVVMKKTPMLEGSRIIFAGTARNVQGGGYEIRIRFDAEGAAQFEKVTAANVQRRMAIVLDGRCYSAPVIQERIAGECRISGSFALKEANDLANVLTAGSLPAQVALESEFTVGPSLGLEQIESGLLATLVGAVLVALFMWFYYRLSGFISVLCLGLNLLVLLGALGFFKATMTLPGIAGILLTMGMAVDANVLIFERLREELARGRPVRLAVQHGFDRAVVTILDSQLTTLLSGIILYYLGTGPVRGFAVTLSLGILVTLFANLWICRQLFDWLVARDAVSALKMMQIIKKPSFDFMGRRRIWMGVSGALVALSMGAFFYLGVLNNHIYDLDFTGGSLIQFNFAKGKEQSDAAMKEAIEKELRPRLRARLQKAAAKLKELAASNTKGAALGQAVFENLPRIGRSQFSTHSEISPKALNELAGRIEEALSDYDKTEFIVQSFGQPAPDSGPERKYRRFTLTTKMTDTAVMSALNDEVLKLFKGQVEPVAVEQVPDRLIRVRFKPELSGAHAPSPEKLRSVVQAELKVIAAAPEYRNQAVQKNLAALKVSPAKIEPYGEGLSGGRPFVELTPLPKGAEAQEDLFEAVQALQVQIGKKKYRAEGPIGRKTKFGKQVSGEMQWTALGAMAAALMGIFLYLWFRFEFSGAWGFGAILALFHDALMAIGAVCLVNVTGVLPILIDLNLVAAILTIIGYSVNDTIVTFDRIREIKTQHPTRAIEEILNEAINATLSRTLLTSATTLLAILSLFILGGPTIRDLSFTLLVGILVGTYSSIFIASPAMMWWYTKYGPGVVARAMKKSPKGKAAPSGAQI